jgi:hypothetical protein
VFENIYTLYPYGSRIYGADHSDSDYDFILVSSDAKSGEMIQGNKHMSPEHFQKLVDEHNELFTRFRLLAPKR